MENCNYRTPPVTPERPTKAGRTRSGFLNENNNMRNGSSQRRLNLDPKLQLSPHAVLRADQLQSPSSPRAAPDGESPERIEKLYRALALEDGTSAPGSHQKLTFSELEDHADTAYDIVSHIQAFENILKLADGDYEASVSIALKPEHSYLVSTVLPSLVRTLLGKMYLSDAEAARTNAFLQHVCAVTIGLLDQGSSVLCTTLSRVFDNERRFYMDYSPLSSSKKYSKPSSVLQSLNSGQTTSMRLSTDGRVLAKGTPESDKAGVSESRQMENNDVNVNTEALNADGAKDTPAVYAREENAMFSSKRLVEIVNFFGNLKGFESLVKQVERVSKEGSFDELAQHIEPFVRVRELLEPHVIADITPVLQSAVQERVTSLSDDDIRSSEVEDALQLVAQLSLFLQQIIEEDEVPNIVTPMEVSVAVRFMESKSLEKRIAGLNHISQQVVKIFLKETRHISSSSTTGGIGSSNNLYGATPPRGNRSSAERYATTPLSIGRRRHKDPGTSPAFMVRLLLQSQVLEKLFGASMHVELVNRSHDVLKFLSFHEAMTTEHLENIWNSARGQHISQVTAVHKCIIAISSDLSDGMLKSFIAILDRVATVDINMLHLLGQLAAKAGEAHGVLDSVCTLLWKLYCRYNLRNEANKSAAGSTDESLLPSIKDLMVSLLTGKIGRALGLPQTYCEICVDQIKAGKDVLRSLQFVQQVIGNIETSSSASHDKSEASSMLMQLEKRHELTSLLVHDLTRYQREAAATALSFLPDGRVLPVGNKDGLTRTLQDAVLVGTTYCHKMQLYDRLKTLLYVLNNTPSSVRLNLDATKDMWETGIECAVTQRDVNLLLEFFLHAINLSSDENRYISMDSASFIFEQLKSGAIPFVNYDEQACECFMKYFRFQNVRNGTLVSEMRYEGSDNQSVSSDGSESNRSEESFRRDWRVSVSRGPDGLSSLWEIIFNAPGKRIANVIISFYNRMHLELCPGFSNSQGPESSERGSRKHRSTRLLRENHIEACLEQFHGARTMYASAQKECNEEVCREAVSQCQSCSFVLREFISAAKDVDDRTEGAEKESRDGTAPDSQTAMSPRKITRVPSFGGDNPAQNRRSSPFQEESLSTLEVRRLQPASIMAEEHYFNALFSMLELNHDDFVMPVFSLLENLPVNAEQIQFMIDFRGQPDLFKLFPKGKIFKTMYSLRILCELLSEEDKESQESFDASNSMLTEKEKALWTMKFGANGGMDILVDLLETCCSLSKNQRGGIAFVTECEKMTIRAMVSLLTHDCKAGEYFDDQQQLSLRSAFCSWKEALTKRSTWPAEKEDLSSTKKCFTRQHAKGVLQLMARSVSSHLRNNCTSEEQRQFVLPASAQNLFYRIFNLFQMLAESHPREVELSLVSDRDNWVTAFRGVLLETPSRHANVRQYISHFAFCACTKSLSIQTEILGYLLKILPVACETRADSAENSWSEQFFLFLSCIIQHFPDDSTDFFPVLTQVVNTTVFLIDDLPVRETTIEQEFDEKKKESTDFVLNGLLKVLLSTLSNRPDLCAPACEEQCLAEKLLCSWLFSKKIKSPDKNKFDQSADATSPKCKSVLSRQTAFSVLREVSKAFLENRQYASNFQEHILPHLGVLQSSTEASGAEKGMADAGAAGLEGRSTSGYVGLQNPGCVCYMISVLQQLFMTKRFRQGILRSKTSCIEDKRESVLYQLQNLFTWLSFSHRQAFLPLEFCHAFKDFDGNPTNLYMQKDADEFLRLFCDRMKDLLKGSREESLVQESFGGKLVNQIICQGIPYVSEREEDFHVLTIDVKGKNNVEDSLRAYVEGDLLSGDNAYYCEEYDMKVPAVKRVCIRDLPNTLILHLKRFEFDFDMMCNLKLNDYCEFPDTLNMLPFTEEGLMAKEKSSNEDNGAKEEEKTDTGSSTKKETKVQDPSYYEYELTGVVVHTGTIDSGHYYSLIRGGEQDENGGTTNWCRFNDHIVSQFDVSEIAHECFGGSERVLSEGYDRVQYRPKVRNAYMLRYERKFRPQKEKPKSAAEGEGSGQDAESAEEKKTEEAEASNPVVSTASVNTFANSEMAKKEASPRSILAMKELSVELSDLAEETQKSCALSPSSQPATVPSALLAKVEEDNDNLMRDQIANDPNSFVHVLRILQLAAECVQEMPEDAGQAASPVEDSLAEWGASFTFTYFFETVIPVIEHLNHLDKPAASLVLRFADVLCTYVSRSADGPTQLFERICSSPSWIAKWFFGSTHKAVRDAIGSFLLKLVESRPAGEDAAFFSTVVKGMGVNMLCEHYPVRFWRHFHEYFGFLQTLFQTHGSARSAATVGSFQMVPRLVDFLLWERSPAAEASGRKPIGGAHHQHVEFGVVLEVLQTLVCASLRATPNGTVTEELPGTFSSTTDQALELSELDWGYLECEEFVDFLLEHCDVPASRNILAHLLFQRPVMSDVVCEHIVLRARYGPIDSLPAVWTLAKQVLEIQDGFQTDRVASLLNEQSGLIHLAKLIRIPSRKLCIIRIMFEWGKGNNGANGLTTVTEYLATVKESVSWMEEWMHGYLKYKTGYRGSPTGPSRASAENKPPPPAPEARRHMGVPRSP